MKLRDASNTSRTAKTIHMRTPANVSRIWKRVHIRDADNVSRVMAGTGTAGTAMTVTATPDGVYGALSSHAPQRIWTNASTAFVTGGSGPYSYSWTVDSGWEAGSPTAASSAFLSPSCGPGDSAFGNAFCTVTDSNGNPANSNDVNLNADNYGI